MLPCVNLLATPFSLSKNAISINTLRLRQNGRHFPDNIFKWIFLNENVYILVKISLKFVHGGPINKIPSLVQIMVWHQPGNKPPYDAVMVSILMHICITWPQWVNSSTPSAAYMHQWTGSALVQIMACRLFDAKPLAKPMLGYLSIRHLRTNFSEMLIKM